jgi:formylmethanofuran dehydrogenase subunit B
LRQKEQLTGWMGVSLRLRKMIESKHPSDEEVLSKLARRVKEITNK